jgi:hypothetical protein
VGVILLTWLLPATTPLLPSYPLLLAPNPSLGPMSRSGKWPKGLAFAVDRVGCEMKANATNCHVCRSFKLRLNFVNAFAMEKNI